MKRPNVHTIYMSFAKMWAQRSHHPKHKVGCVITSLDGCQTYAVGYNGMEAGGTNTIDSNEPGKSGCIHAEVNACIKNKSSSDDKKNIYVTLAPCLMCARMFINLGGVVNLYYLEEYRDKTGIKLLQKRGIKCKKLAN